MKLLLLFRIRNKELPKLIVAQTQLRGASGKIITNLHKVIHMCKMAQDVKNQETANLVFPHKIVRRITTKAAIRPTGINFPTTTLKMATIL